MRVYVSGAISGLPLDEARATFRSACERLADDGHDTLNPFDVPPRTNCRCATEDEDRAGAGGNHEWACYLRADLVAMLDCDAIYMLPGWERSHGARLELTVAAAVGLRVLGGVPVDTEEAP